MRDKGIKILFIVFVLFILTLTGITASNESDGQNDFEETKRVLLISSYSPGFQTFFRQTEGIKEAFGSYNIAFDVEFMDSKRFFTDENYENFDRTLTYKVTRLEPYDAVMVSDDNALNHIMEIKDELFPDIPIVFLGVNNAANAALFGQEALVTGVVEASSIRETIEAASLLQPEATQVVALTDNTTSGQADLELYYSDENRVSGLTYKDIDLSDMTFDTFSLEVSKLSEESIILLLSVYSDINQNRIDFEEGLDLVLSNASEPVYHPYYHGLGDGVAGGKVISHHEQGMSAAGLVLRILNGEDAAEIEPVFESPNKYIYDYEVLKSFGLDEDILPEDSILINYESTVFEEYGLYILAVLAVIALQTLIILKLIKAIKDRKSAEEELKVSHLEVLKSNSDLSESNEELMVTNEELTATYEEVEKQNRQIHSLVYIDQLTGLGNRQAISEDIIKTIEKDTVSAASIMFVDVDNFKHINDTYGHDIGDLVIKKTADRLRNLESECLHIGRFGGDEFLILVTGYECNRDIERLAADVLELFAEVVDVGGIKFYLTVSIGLVEYPEHGRSERDLLKRADMALYEAKRLGKGRYEFFNRNMMESMEEKLLFQSQIRTAIQNDEFYLNYQPIINIETDSIFGYEALIRWNSKVYGYVSPINLIQNLEEMGLIVSVGEHIMRMACRFSRKMAGLMNEPIKVAVNVSPLQLMHDDFFDRVMTVMSEENCGPDSISFEMTESTLVGSMKVAAQVIQNLKHQGYEIALDDFGSGYSSLSYFRDLPISVLKIDRAFITDINNDSYNSSFVEAIISIAHEKGIGVISEGVESKEELEVLRSLKCENVQGYYYAKPMGEEEALKFSTSRRIYKD